MLPEPEPAAAMESFWARLDTSSDDETQQPLLLVNLFRLRHYPAGTFREDLGGFIAAWVVVLILVAGTAVVLTR